MSHLEKQTWGVQLPSFKTCGIYILETCKRENDRIEDSQGNVEKKKKSSNLGGILIIIKNN